MTRVTIHRAKTHLARLLEEVEKAGEVVISRRDKPIARFAAACSPASIATRSTACWPARPWSTL